jgi:ubiquinone/menaquinone biosynthesis C-methylase UbiE
MMSDDNDITSAIGEHYKQQAEEHGASTQSTMADEITRRKELETIEDFLNILQERPEGAKLRRVLDMGCGNGCALEYLSKRFQDCEFWGCDSSKEMIQVAQKRNLENCRFFCSDARNTSFEDGAFDVVYTERCLINILEWEHQVEALREIVRIMKSDGHYLMIECFTDGQENYNRARVECGLPAVEPAWHNLYFDKERLFESLKDVLTTVRAEDIDPHSGGRCPSNFLSTHYFVARVLYPLVTKGAFARNTEFVKFLSPSLPLAGEYSPIQAYILAKS